MFGFESNDGKTFFFLGNHHKGHVASIVQPCLAPEAARGRPEEREVLAFHSGMTLSFRQRAVARALQRWPGLPILAMNAQH